MNRRSIFKLFAAAIASKSVSIPDPISATPVEPPKPAFKRIKIKRIFNAIPEITLAGVRGDWMVELPGIFPVHPKTGEVVRDPKTGKGIPRLVMLTSDSEPMTFYPHIILDGPYRNAWADPEMYEVIDD